MLYIFKWNQFAFKRSNLISNFNIPSITSFYFTLKNGNRLDISDINNVIVYSFTNNNDDFVYYQYVNYNSNMLKISLYDQLNVLIV